MTWRHVMLALPTVLAVPDHLLDRVGRLARGLDAELELFHCVYAGARAGPSAPAAGGRPQGFARRISPTRAAGRAVK